MARIHIDTTDTIKKQFQRHVKRLDTSMNKRILQLIAVDMKIDKMSRGNQK